jgi:L-malate glycosyltransferase
MNILHTVEFYSPSVGGAQEVVKQLSERMVALGHQVTIATTTIPERKSQMINGVRIVDFNISGNAVRGYHGDTEAYKEFLLKNRFDVIMNYAAQQWTADLFFEVMNQIKAKKVFVPCGFLDYHNLVTSHILALCQIYYEATMPPSMQATIIEIAFLQKSIRSTIFT